MWDLSLPGYKYLGPGNAINKGEPTNLDDLIAYLHDLGYGQIIQNGDNPYLKWSNADAIAYRRWQANPNKTWGGRAAQGFFGLKKLLHGAGLISSVEEKSSTPQENTSGQKRPADSEQPAENKRLRGSTQLQELDVAATLDKPSERKTHFGSQIAQDLERKNQAYKDAKKRLEELNPADKLREWSAKNNNDKVSLPDSTSATQAAMSGGGGVGSGNAAGLKETQVDDPYVVYRGPPDFTFCSLPFLEEKVAHFTSAQEQWAIDHIYRMTSPYDAVHETASTDLNAGLGTASHITETTDSATRSARWFNYYAGLYRYYHVVSAKWSIFVENLSMEPIYVHQMFMNDTVPPGGATNEDIILWSEARTKYLQPVGRAIQSTGMQETEYIPDTDNAITVNEEDEGGGYGDTPTFETGNLINHPGSNICQFSGIYRPGQFNREIRLDSEVENWTLTTTNPALPERLLIRIKPVAAGISASDTVTYGDTLKYRLRCRVDYLVEFKELKDGLRWPVSRQPLTVTINTAIGDT